VTRFFLVAAALFAAGCTDSFVAPRLPDLYKDPYDFAVEVPPYTGPGADLSPVERPDLSANEPRDLALPGPQTD
jgi:hypothetical protein